MEQRIIHFIFQIGSHLRDESTRISRKYFRYVIGITYSVRIYLHMLVGGSAGAGYEGQEIKYFVGALFLAGFGLELFFLRHC